MRRAISIRVLRGIYLTRPVSEFALAPPGMTADFLDPETVRRMSAEAKYELPPDFLDEALGKGDECYAILQGDELAAYGWYAHTPTQIDSDLCVRFDDAYVYMYKGLTLNAHRGRRLHAIGKTRALAAYQARGYKGLVSYVDGDNLSSLKSNYRMGCVDFGRVWVLRIFGRYLIFRTPGCAAFGFSVVATRRKRAPEVERRGTVRESAARPAPERR
ncbi:MAG TPA: hypothetical protein VIW28_05070 [Gemmatimonadales bacterium]